MKGKTKEKLMKKNSLKLISKNEIDSVNNS